MSDTPRKGIELTKTRSIEALEANIPCDNTAEESTGAPGNHITSLKLHLITAAHDVPVNYGTQSLIRIFRLSMSLFLTSLDIPVVVTTLI